MAGAGYKLFNTGDVLTAAQVNTYLQEQAVMRFANAAARTTALTSVLAEGMVSYLQDTNAVEVYDGSNWVSIGSSGDITAVTTAANSGLAGGATSGAVALNLATAAKGDLLVGTGANTASVLTVGSNNTVLTADSTTATGLKWATAAGGGDFVKIASSTFSNQASVTVDSVFDSTYKNYMVILKVESNAGVGQADDLQVQFRYSSTTQASDYYGSYFQYNRGNTLTTGGFSNTAQNTVALNIGDSTSATWATLNFFNVGTGSENAGYYSSGNNISADQAAFVGTGWVNVARLYTGFLIKSSSSNITGSYAVWGLKR